MLCWFIGRILVKRQTVYQKATQDRINFTSEVLGSIKAVKMLGYTERFTSLLEDKRDQDLNVGKHYREMIVWANTVGKLICFAYNHGLFQNQINSSLLITRKRQRQLNASRHFRRLRHCRQAQQQPVLLGIAGHHCAVHPQRHGKSAQLPPREHFSCLCRLWLLQAYPGIPTA